MPVDPFPPRPPLNLERVPRATYRLQLNGNFGFQQAAAVSTYLAALGISHCYTSPYLKARPGSTHGYDIIDHHALNPEIGTGEDYIMFVDALNEQGMGHILDLVPNHMGVMGGDNAWWLDVLEHGPASLYADYFDIEWQPLNPSLQHKLLVPVLADHYGQVLERNDIKLAFHGEQGAFTVSYHEHLFPVDPCSYPRILSYHEDRLAHELGADHEALVELQSIYTSFSHLPSQLETETDKRAERARDSTVHKKRLADLCRRHPVIGAFIEANVSALNTPGMTVDDDHLLHRLLEVQAYRLAYWRVAADDINYRRFFDINELAGLRMENTQVFEATHEWILSLFNNHYIQGLRIDHIDGLSDPAGYCRMLTSSIRHNVYLVAEKILMGNESLPADWSVDGTTGYDVADWLTKVLIHPGGNAPLTRAYLRFTGDDDDFDEVQYRCKKIIMGVYLSSELYVLSHQLDRLAAMEIQSRDYTLHALREAVSEYVACFPVYRTYCQGPSCTDDDIKNIELAITKAKQHSRLPDLSVFDFLHRILLLHDPYHKTPVYYERALRFVGKLQQYTAPVMAKGTEDTAHYRYNRLVALNEVGSEPGQMSLSPEQFHRYVCGKQQSHPYTMIAGSTHDSKRSEDVRARISVLSEIPKLWSQTLTQWRKLNRGLKQQTPDGPCPSANDELLIYQTLVGSYPMTSQDRNGYVERIQHYMVKAVREAKQHSSWINPDTAYEARLTQFIERILTPDDDNRFLPGFTGLTERLLPFGLMNSLSQTLLRLTLPGVPDIYQGNERWRFDLVDPDNRTPVAFDHHEQLLDQLVQRYREQPLGCVRALAEDPVESEIKLFLIWRTLQWRKRLPALFTHGDYTPLYGEGPASQHTLAFQRRHENRLMWVVVPRFLLTLLDSYRFPHDDAWLDTWLPIAALEERRYTLLFSGETVLPEKHRDGYRFYLPQLFKDFPFCVITDEGP